MTVDPARAALEGPAADCTVLGEVGAKFCERLNDDVLFRFFLDMNLDDATWDQSTFAKNRDRLIKHDVARSPDDVTSRTPWAPSFTTWNGAFAIALCEGRALREAARFANANAALSVTRNGAQDSLPTRSEVDTLLAETPLPTGD